MRSVRTSFTTNAWPPDNTNPSLKHMCSSIAGFNTNAGRGAGTYKRGALSGVTPPSPFSSFRSRCPTLAECMHSRTRRMW